jgi:hypothetical protein
MKIAIRSVGLWAFLILALLGAGQANKVATPPRKEILAAIESHQGVVLVVSPKPDKALEASEAYADWASYLNKFARKEGANMKIVRLTPQNYAEALAEPKLEDSFATLFVRDSTHGLLYKGMIVEPLFYQAGKAYLSEKSDAKPALPHGLQEISVRLRP